MRRICQLPLILSLSLMASACSVDGTVISPVATAAGLVASDADVIDVTEWVSGIESSEVAVSDAEPSDLGEVVPVVEQGSDELAPEAVADAIYFTSAGSDEVGLFEISATGGAPKMLAELGQSGDISLSPDARTVVYSEYQPADPGRIGELDLVLVDLVDDTRSKLTDIPGNELDAVWSPDGRWLLYRQTSGDGAGLRIASPADGTTSPAISNADVSPAWATRAHMWGATVETIVMRSDSEEVVVAGADGDRTIAESMRLAGDISVNPDGTTVAYVVDALDRSRFFDSNLRSVSTSGTTDILISDQSGLKHRMSWSPDGQWIAFLNEEDLVSGLFVAAADGSEVREITGPQAGRFLTAPIWSPTSEALVVGVSTQASDADLVVYDLAGEMTSLGVAGNPVAWRGSVPESPASTDEHPAPEPQPEEEPIAPEPSGNASSVFDGSAGSAPAFATGVGGSCRSAADMWLDGFTIDVYLADASGIAEITTLLFAAPNSISIATVPRSDAWPLLETALGSHSDFGSLSPNDVHSVSRLGMLAFDVPLPEDLAQMEAELAVVIDAARRTSGVLVVTDDRCTDNATPQLVQN